MADFRMLGSIAAELMKLLQIGLPMSIIRRGQLALGRLAQGGASSNQVLTWNGSAWAPAAAQAGFTNPMTTLGDLIYENATPAAARLAGDTSNTRRFLRTQASGGVAQAPAWDVPTEFLLGSVLINGGCDFAQRQTPGTFTNVGTNAADAYGADRWKMGIQNAIATAQAQYARTDTNGALETGITARYYGTCKMTGAASKAMVYQPIEGSNCFPLASRALTFQVSIKASKSITVNIAILQLNSSGTIDTIPAQLNSSWSNTAGTDPTWATNIAVVGSKQACSVTTSWQTFTVNVTAPSNAKNLLCVMWTDAQMSVNDTFSWTQAGLYDGAVAPAWLPRPTQQELALCERYYEKAYAVDSPPGTTWTAGSWSAPAYPSAGQASGNTTYLFNPFRVRKRAVPTITVYDSAGTSGKVSGYNGTTWVSGQTPAAGPNAGETTWGVSAPAALAYVAAAYTADCEL